MNEQLAQWLRDAYLGVPHWFLIVAGLFAVAEWLLGRSKNPQLRSVAAVIAKGMSVLVQRLYIVKIPVVGALLVNVLEAIAGHDLDGDGDVGE